MILTVYQGHISLLFEKNPSYPLQPGTSLANNKFQQPYLLMRMADWMLPPFQQPTSLEKISFPTSFSLTGSWTTTQKLLIGWIEIDSFYPWVPGAQKKPGEKFPTLLRIWWCIWKTGGKWFRWKKCTKNMKRDGNSLAKHDNVILDVHPSSIIKKSLWKWTIAPQICGNWLN